MNENDSDKEITGGKKAIVDVRKKQVILRGSETKLANCKSLFMSVSFTLCNILVELSSK